MPKLRKSALDKRRAAEEARRASLGAHIKLALELSCGSVTKATKRLGCSQTHLYDIINRPERIRVRELWRIMDGLAPADIDIIRALVCPDYGKEATGK
jgi:hypothetical protein